MKQVIYALVPFILSVVICLLYMDTTKEETIPVINEVNQTKIFKTGSYDELDSAEKEASSKKGITIKNEDKYEVVIGILKNNSNIERMISYLDEKGSFYYIEDLQINMAFIDTLNKYEELMLSSTSSVSFLQLNKKILERYKILYES